MCLKKSAWELAINIVYPGKIASTNIRKPFNSAHLQIYDSYDCSMCNVKLLDFMSAYCSGHVCVHLTAPWRQGMVEWLVHWGHFWPRTIIPSITVKIWNRFPGISPVFGLPFYHLSSPGIQQNMWSEHLAWRRHGVSVCWSKEIGSASYCAIVVCVVWGYTHTRHGDTVKQSLSRQDTVLRKTYAISNLFSAAAKAVHLLYKWLQCSTSAAKRYQRVWRCTINQ